MYHIEGLHHKKLQTFNVFFAHMFSQNADNEKLDGQYSDVPKFDCSVEEKKIWKNMRSGKSS